MWLRTTHTQIYTCLWVYMCDSWAIRARASCSFSGNLSGNLSFGGPNLSIWGQWLYDLPLSMNNGHLGTMGDSPFMSIILLSGF